MEKLGLILAALLTLVVVAILLAWPTQWLWNNALVGAVDGVHEIRFFQALGLNILCGILFRNSSSSK
jgi:hypothetical protein